MTDRVQGLELQHEEIGHPCAWMWTYFPGLLQAYEHNINILKGDVQDRLDHCDRRKKRMSPDFEWPWPQ